MEQREVNMKTQKITYILIFLILVNCVKEKAKENDPTEEALSYLRTLRPQHNQLTKEKMGEIEAIGFESTAITDDKLKYVLIFPKLRTLMLSKTKITEAGLSTLKDNNIWSLDIDSTLITNKAIKVLRDWKHLEILNISYTNIDDGALEDILKLKIGRLEAAGTKLSEKAKERIRKKMQFEDEDYEL
ncbi:leucine rich repeat protein [Leptospira weilii str. LNT 1234]|nr:leucine rich repeat protein [Leptospira weilii str. LNT 1234]